MILDPRGWFVEQRQTQALQRDIRVLESDKVTIVAEGEKRVIDLNKSLEVVRASFQAATDIITNASDTTDNQHYTGNPYKTYPTQVSALSNKYNLTSDWGCMTAKNIIDVRAAFMIGRGVQVIKRDNFSGDATREMEFIRSFINFNNIDEEAPQDWAVGSEIEGKVMVRLVPVIGGMIRTIYVPWRKYPYTITADKSNFYRYTRAFYDGQDTPTSAIDPQTFDASFNLREQDFVYKRFGGTAEQVNATPPKTAFVLRQIEDSDKELWDWRKINSLFASPTPVITVETAEEADRVNDQIKNKDWRIGKALVLANGKFDLVMYKGEGYTTIQKAAEADIQAISGATGVPVHFLGHPELLSNRATAENLLELIELSTGKERKVWVGGYEELFQKAIIMHNDVFRNNLNPMAVDARIPFTSSSSLAVIENVYLPMYTAGAMSLQQLLSYLSELDTEKEIERIKEDTKDEILSQRRTAGNGGQPNTGNGRSGVAGKNQENR